jgi:hypothetical protein
MKASKMCRGSIKILKDSGCLERKKDQSGLTIVLGSPEEAGKRLFKQAMDSINKKKEYALEV